MTNPKHPNQFPQSIVCHASFKHHALTLSFKLFKHSVKRETVSPMKLIGGENG